MVWYCILYYMVWFCRVYPTALCRAYPTSHYINCVIEVVIGGFGMVLCTVAICCRVCGTIWTRMVHYGQYSTTWYTWYWYMVVQYYYYMKLNGTVWCGVVQFGIAWYGVVWWFSLVWCCLVWFGVVHFCVVWLQPNALVAASTVGRHGCCPRFEL